jgi:hypothetical protein
MGAKLPAAELNARRPGQSNRIPRNLTAMQRTCPSSLGCLALIIACLVAFSSPAEAKEKEKQKGFRLPPPPPPGKVVRDIRGFFHRVADGVKDASKQTWGAIRDRFDGDEPPPRTARTKPRPKTNEMPPPDSAAFARSKEAVPYPHDDADPFAGPRPPGTPPEGPTPEQVAPQDAARFGQTVDPKAADPAAHQPSPSAASESPAPSSPSLSPPTKDPVPSTPSTIEPPLDGNIPYAQPVPGRRGLVYPPGAKATEESMIDVGDFQTGQIVRDPRSGKLFRVP